MAPLPAPVAQLRGIRLRYRKAPALDGITKQLLERHGPSAGLMSKTRRVTLDDVMEYRAAFVANSQGIAPVCAVDQMPVAVDESLMASLYRAYASAPWDAI